MMKGKGVQKPCFLIISVNIICKLKSLEFLTLMVPRMHPNDGRVVSNFVVQAMQNKNLTIYGNGKQTRSFCYVDDMIDGLIKLMNSSNDFTGPINLGNPEEINILTLAKKIINFVNSEV